ncbi:ATP-grasp domain-containing protein, partial [Bacillus sp. WP8]|uniref:ATP-grasp domain-containing protein n=1 Tax=Bacillus sp. WP8 TaxID=756828 RepID=UPI0037C16C9F
MLQTSLPFQIHLSLILTPSLHPHIPLFPLPHNIHNHNIFFQTILPPTLHNPIQHNPKQLPTTLPQNLPLLPTLPLQLFLTNHPNLHLNQLPPPPHNSPHYTLHLSHTTHF